jgi:hypothetical protein
MTKYYPNHRFGQLTLKEKFGNRAIVVCDCGNEIEVFMSHLTQGGKSNCGCDKKSIIYFIQVQNYVKIGRVGDNRELANRLGVVQTNCPYDAELIRTISGARDTEKSLHKKFQSLHKQGEWFEYDPEMLTYRPAANSET